jgi:carboxymethylenebutenolidase
MIERLVAVPTASGRMETFITHPVEGGPFPAVVLYMDIWGIREELHDIARRVATVGYCCLVPDLYYRQGRVRNEFRDERNRMVSFALLDAAQKEQVRTPLEKLTDTMVVDDTGALLDFLARGEPVRPGAMGSIGYCMGGRHVFCVAGAFPDRFRASASLHGTALVTDGADSPHRVVRTGQGELYCGFGEKDHWASPATVAALAANFADTGIRYRYEVHAGAEHGYALPDRDVHHKQAANRDWEIIFAMFRRQMPHATA